MTQEGEDCYFYYYSTCKKGSTCLYRHEPSSRGTEAICEDWEFGKCVKEHCPLRHMRIQVNRSTIPCYWESQPMGCQKPHCAFRHRKEKSTMIPTSVGDLKVAKSSSPKVEQILIHMADTDEESPQKTAPLKPAIDRQRGAQVPLKYATVARSSAKGRQEEQNVKHDSQILEDELKEFAKKGISVENSAAVVKQTGSSALQVKVKTLKEIKREKILKARLEYERKRLLASQQSQESGVSQEFRGKAVECSVARPTDISVDTGRAASEKVPQQSAVPKESASPSQGLAPKRRWPRRDLSAAVEVSNGKSTADAKETNPAGEGEVRVKTFSEIMEEKRRRLAKQQTPAADTQASLSPMDVTHKPVIAPRKLKIPLGVTKKPIRLKRAIPPSLREPHGEMIPKGAKARPLSSENSENQKPKSPVSHSDTAMSPTARDTSNGPQTTDDLCSKRASTNDRCDLDSDSEMDLLGSSGYLKGDATQTASDVSDEEFMNEMEQLLA